MFKFPWTKRAEAHAVAELAENTRRETDRERRLAAIKSSNIWTGQNRHPSTGTHDSWPTLVIVKSNSGGE